MPKVKYDVSGSDHDRAASGGGPRPKPGWYKAKVKTITTTFAKDDAGKPDRKRPMLEVIYEIVKDKKFKGAQMYDYVSFSEAAQWKMDQFLQAMGINTKKKSKGSFDTDDFIGNDVKIRVKGGTYNEEYSPKIGMVASADSEDEDEDEDETDAEEEEDVEDDEDEDDDSDEEEDEEDDEEEEEVEEDDDEEEEEEKPAKKSSKKKAKPAPKKSAKAPAKKGKKKKSDEDDDLPF